MPEKKPSKRRQFTDEFKRSAVDLIVNQNYSFIAASKAVSVDVTVLNRIQVHSFTVAVLMFGAKSASPELASIRHKLRREFGR